MVEMYETLEAHKMLEVGVANPDPLRSGWMCNALKKIENHKFFAET